MAWDEGEAELMREGLAHLPEGRVAEKRMFGGLCFLHDGNMIGGVSGQGGALMRVGKANAAEAEAIPGVAPMIHGGRRMGGFVRVSAEAWGDDAARGRLLALSLGFVLALPSK